MITYDIDSILSEEETSIDIVGAIVVACGDFKGSILEEDLIWIIHEFCYLAGMSGLEHFVFNAGLQML